MHPNWKVKLSLFANDMILYVENPKDSIRTLLKQIKKFNKVAGHKSIRQNLFHFYTLIMNYQKKKLRKTIS